MSRNVSSVGGPRQSLFGEGAERDGDVFLGPVAQDLEVHGGVGSTGGDVVRELGSIPHLAAVHCDDHVVGLQASLVGGAALVDVRDDRALGFLEVVAASERLGHVLDRHAQPAADDPPFRAELGQDLLGHVDRHREPDARRLLGTVGDDHGVDADDLALGVDERPDMETADARVAIVTSARVVLMNDVAEFHKKFRELGRLDGAVFDEGDGFALSFHAQKQSQTCFSHFPNIGLLQLVECAYIRIAGLFALERGFQRIEFGPEFGSILAIELHNENRGRIALNEAHQPRNLQ